MTNDRLRQLLDEIMAESEQATAEAVRWDARYKESGEAHHKEQADGLRFYRAGLDTAADYLTAAMAREAADE